MNIANAKNYDRVMVSAIRHTNDDVEGKEDANMLVQVIDDKFRVGSTVFNIPLHDTAHAELKTHIQDITRVQPGQKELLLIHYGGHGDSRGLSSRPSLWGSPDLNYGEDVHVNWAEIIQEQLQKCRKDVVLILDCCSAASAFRSQPRGRLVIVAACAREEVTYAEESSYTRSLVKVLERLGSAMSIRELFDAVGKVRSQRGLNEPVLYERPVGAASTIFIAPWPQSAYFSTEDTPLQPSPAYQPSIHAIERPRPLISALKESHYLTHSGPITVRSPTTSQLPPRVLLKPTPREFKSSLILKARGPDGELPVTVGFGHAIETGDLTIGLIRDRLRDLATLVGHDLDEAEISILFYRRRLLLHDSSTCLSHGISDKDTIQIPRGYDFLYALSTWGRIPQADKRPRDESEDPVQDQSNKRRRI